jgi:diguanylate cyclase (GGDEF)-like protein
MDLKRYLQVALKGWWLILPALLVSITSALVFTYNQTPIYRTSATFIVSPSDSLSELKDVFTGLNMLSKRDGIMMTYTEIATSRTILDAVYKEMGLTKEQLEYLNVSSEMVPSTNIIRITVESNDPLIAKDCANLIGQETIKYVGNLYEAYGMKLLDPAYIPRLPSKPKKAQNLILAAILGSLLGGGLAFLAEYLRSPKVSIASVNIIDSATGVYNRYYFLQRLGEELSRAKRHRYPLSLGLMSIERLDTIGDMRFPQLRNEILRRVAFYIKQYLREEDIMARFEGEKFAFLLPDTDGQSAQEILKKLQTRIEWNVFELEESDIKLNLTSVCGVAAYDLNGSGRDELLSEAETALQRAGVSNGYSKICLSEQKDSRQDEPTVND